MNRFDRIQQLRGDFETDFLWSIHERLRTDDLEELDDDLARFNQELLDVVRTSDGTNEFLQKVSELEEKYEGEEEQRFEAYTLQKLRSSVDYNPNTIRIIEDIENYSWREVKDSLEETGANLSTEEAMYRNRIESWALTLSSDQLSEALKSHYMREKRRNPERAENMDEAVKKIFYGLGFRKYDEVLEQVEIIPEDESERYMQNLEQRLMQKRDELSNSVYQDFLSIIEEADNVLQLAAYTQDSVEASRKGSERSVEEMEEVVQEVYIEALQEGRVH